MWGLSGWFPGLTVADEEADFGGGAEDLAGFTEGVTGGEVGIIGIIGEDVVWTEELPETAVVEDLHDLGMGAADEDIAIVLAGEADQFLDSHGAGSVEVMGIAEAEEKKAEVGVFADPAGLFEEDIAGAEEEVAFDMEEGQLGLGGGWGSGSGGDAGFHVVLDKLGLSGLAEEEDH